MPAQQTELSKCVSFFLTAFPLHRTDQLIEHDRQRLNILRVAFTYINNFSKSRIFDLLLFFCQRKGSGELLYIFRHIFVLIAIVHGHRHTGGKIVYLLT
nr:MAG TPA: hypothetical protein [Ackermannviridae sp.]